MSVENRGFVGDTASPDGPRGKAARSLPPPVHMSDRAATLHRCSGFPRSHRPYRYSFFEKT